MTHRSRCSRPAVAAFSALVTSLVLVSAGRAHAADIADRGTFVISADRLFGFSATRTRYEDGGDSQTTDRTALGLFLPGSAATAFTMPRLALDAAVMRGLTIGLAFGYANESADTSGRLGAVRFDISNDSSTRLLLAPRVGYALRVSDNFQLWLRGGFTYFRSSLETANNDIDAWLFAFDLEPTLVYSPFAHLGFALSGVADLPLAGASDYPGRGNVDYGERNFGITVGLLALF